MKQGFSGEPLTRWKGDREMILEEEFYYVDSHGKQWIAPVNSVLNGATIPKALWNKIGSPFVGQYRRASVVHDVAVGELDNPDVSLTERKKADRMFYDACLHDNCGKQFSLILYIGVRIGTFLSSWGSLFNKDFTTTFGREINLELDVQKKEENEQKVIIEKFEQILEESKDAIAQEDLDGIDDIIEKYKA